MTEKEQQRINLDYAELLSKMSNEKKEFNPLYEKAFLDRNEKPASEYNQNTTTWD